MIVDVTEDSDGNSVIPIPEELSADWQDGDVVEWKVEYDETGAPYVTVFNKTLQERNDVAAKDLP